MNEKLQKVFMWLAYGLFVTFMTSYLVGLNNNFVEYLNNNPRMVFPFLILPFVSLIFIAMSFEKRSTGVVIAWYTLFSAIEGCLFAALFTQFESKSVVLILLLTTVLFIILAISTKFIKSDLRKWGSILFISLLVMIVAEFIVIIFIRDANVYHFLAALGVPLFMGYILYDVKRVSYDYEEKSGTKYDIMFAFDLYLDFICLFTRLLFLFAKEK